MKITYFISFLFSIISFNLLGQGSISAKAKEDQIASKLWSALGSDLLSSFDCKTVSIVDQLENELAISKKEIGTFLGYSLNYSDELLNAEQVIYRFPHYNKDSILNDYESLSASGLIAKDSLGWSVTPEGIDLIAHYWQYKIESYASCKEENDHLISLITLTDKLFRQYEQMNLFQSLRLRIKNRPDSIDEWPAILIANELQKDLTSIFNDNGHYRIDLLQQTSSNEKWNSYQLGPLAKELLGATRNQRKYPVENCINQANWRMGSEGCSEAIRELMEANLIKIEHDSISQTSDGRELFQAADLLADNRLYSAWDILSEEEYNTILESIAWITKSNK